MEDSVSIDAKGTKILARTFFQQLRSAGYTPKQIIGVATELIDLVTLDLKENAAAVREAALPVDLTPAPAPMAHATKTVVRQ
jgi:pyruvate-formate lyase-activating enzyme